MNHSALILEIPEMDDENIAKLHDFIYDLLRTFESHYYHQLSRHVRSEKRWGKHFDNLLDGQDPF